MTELYCPLLWKELFIENDGYISPCLQSTNKLFNTNIVHQSKKANISTDEIHQNLDGLVEMREQMKQGVWPKQCVNCQIKESKNLISHRQNSLNKYNNRQTVELKHLLLRVGNVCNIRCVMCGPWASNQWYNDYVELNNSTEFKNNQNTYTLNKKHNGDFYIKNSQLNSNNWENILLLIAAHSNELEKISFHGGEPLVSKIHHKIIDELVKLDKTQDISLEYFSNFFQIPEHFFNTVDNFKKITFYISLDGVAEINDAVRWPSKYAEIENNICRMQTKSNVELKIHHTINILNCEHVVDFIKQHNQFEVDLNFVREPLYSSIKLFDSHDVDLLKTHLKSKDKSIYDQYCISDLIDSTMSIKVNDQNKKHHRRLFVKMWDQFSKKQNQNWKELFPFAYKLYNEWSNN